MKLFRPNLAQKSLVKFNLRKFWVALLTSFFVVLFPMYIIAIVSIILIQGTCASRGMRLAEHYDACLQGKDSMLGQLDKMMVYGIGVGAKEVEGKPLDQLAIRFYVHEKIVKPRPDIAIPSEINGCPTDVIVTPPFKLYGSRRAPQSRHRPVIGGVSIGTFDTDSYGHSEGMFLVSIMSLLVSCTLLP